MNAQVDRRVLLRAAATVLGVGASAAAAGCAPGSSERSGGETSTTASMSSMSSMSLPGVRTVVTGNLSAAQLESISDDAEKAAAAVTSFWGEGRARGSASRVRLTAFSDRAAFVAAGGDPHENAVTATTTEAGVVLISPALVRAAAAARVFVLTHELSHVRLGVRSEAPRWVAEGAAELTALRASELTLAQYAPSLADKVASGAVPDGPPSDTALAASAPDLRGAYQQACAYSLFLLGRAGATGYRGYIEDAMAGTGNARFETVFAGSPHALRPVFRRWLVEQVRPRR